MMKMIAMMVLSPPGTDDQKENQDVYQACSRHGASRGGSKRNLSTLGAKWVMISDM